MISQEIKTCRSISETFVHPDLPWEYHIAVDVADHRYMWVTLNCARALRSHGLISSGSLCCSVM